jgi:hypothetical protein
MWGQIGGEAKIAIARRVLGQIIEGLPETMNVGLRIYGHRYGLNDPKACADTELIVPIRPVEKARLIDTVNKIQLKGKTPLVHSVLEAIKDFAAIPNGSIILVTDGIESCGGDIRSVGPAVKGSGLEIKVHIVGFDVTAAAERQELETIARSTDGTYIDARDAESLLSALRQTLQAEFVVLDAKGKEVARGAVGGPPVELRPGDYTLRVLLARTDGIENHAQGGRKPRRPHQIRYANSEPAEGDGGEAENLHIALVARSRSRTADDENLVPATRERHPDLVISRRGEERVEDLAPGKRARLEPKQLKTIAFQVGAGPFFEGDGLWNTAIGDFDLNFLLRGPDQGKRNHVLVVVLELVAGNGQRHFTPCVGNEKQEPELWPVERFVVLDPHEISPQFFVRA